MLNKLKKFLKKQKGFTLVELLAVIAILAIVVAIAVPTIGNVVSKSEDKAKKANGELIENAARLADVSGDWDTGSAITLTELVQKGYLDEIPEDGDGNAYKGGVKKNNDAGDADGSDSIYEYDSTIVSSE